MGNWYVHWEFALVQKVHAGVSYSNAEVEYVLEKYSIVTFKSMTANQQIDWSSTCENVINAH